MRLLTSGIIHLFRVFGEILELIGKISCSIVRRLNGEGHGSFRLLVILFIATGSLWPSTALEMFDERLGMSALISRYVADTRSALGWVEPVEVVADAVALEPEIEETQSWVNPHALTEIEVGEAIVAAGCKHHYEFLLKRSQCESSWVTWKCDYVDGTHCGLTQIGKQHPPRLGYHLNDRFDRVKNMEMACALLDEPGGGEYPWTASNECWEDGPNLTDDNIRDGWNHLTTLEDRTYFASND